MVEPESEQSQRVLQLMLRVEGDGAQEASDRRQHVHERSATVLRRLALLVKAHGLQKNRKISEDESHRNVRQQKH